MSIRNYYKNYVLKNIFAARLCMREYNETNFFKRVWFDLKMYMKCMRRDVLPSFDLSIGTVCTLKCKDCSQWSPYLNNKSWMGINDVINNMNNMLKTVNFIFSIAVVGGEPLANPDFKMILDYLINNNKIGNVIVVTNGTICPIDDVLESLSNSKIRLWVSEYSSLPSEVNRERLYYAIEKYSIKSKLLKDDVWKDVGRPVKRYNYTIEQVKSSFNSCWLSNCCMYLNGFFYRCPRCYGIENIFGDDVTNRSEVIDFRKVCSKKDLKIKLKAFYSVNYVEACYYCNLKRKEIIAGEQVE